MPQVMKPGSYVSVFGFSTASIALVFKCFPGKLHPLGKVPSWSPGGFCSFLLLGPAGNPVQGGGLSCPAAASCWIHLIALANLFRGQIPPCPDPGERFGPDPQLVSQCSSTNVTSVNTRSESGPVPLTPAPCGWYCPGGHNRRGRARRTAGDESCPVDERACGGS